jgi:hypothetical protein
MICKFIRINVVSIYTFGEIFFLIKLDFFIVYFLYRIKINSLRKKIMLLKFIK